MARKKYQPPKDILGLNNLLGKTIGMTAERQAIGKAAFKGFILTAPLTKKPIISKIYKSAVKMGPNKHTQGYSIPLNVSIKGENDKQVALPADMLKETIAKASYIAIFDSCVCREIQDCQDYPKELACIFLGEAAKVLVERGVAREGTLNECIERIEEATKLGLSGQAYWIEAEQPIWGFEPKKMDRFLEICFCCPCCCTAFKFVDRADDATRDLFHRSIGWVAEVDPEKCIGCLECQEICPRHAIDEKDGKAVINNMCGGCELCVHKCSQNAISLKHIANYERKPLLDHFQDIELKL